MRKFFVILFAFIVLFFNTSALFAADNDYKNNLLKIEVVQIDENNYDIGIYTQKIYNEPVKIVKKSDTTYYFLLPETSHSVTSVPVVGSVKNVMVKSYPYAGQDLNNGYTKVAIITSKPLNLTTSLKTIDTSVSPRLDPIRLARLDKVFERYSERLAEGNIPSPLSEFKKTNVAQRPSIQSNIDVKNDDTDIIALEPKTKPIVQEQIKPIVQEKVETKPVVKVQKTQVATKPVVKPNVQPNMAQTVKPATKPSVQPNVAQTVKPIVKQQAPIQQAPVIKDEKPTIIAQNISPDITEVTKESSSKQMTAEQFEKQLPTTEPTNVEFNSKIPVDIDGNKEITAEVLEPIEQANKEAEAEKVKTKAPVQQQAIDSKYTILILLCLFPILLFAYVQQVKNRKRTSAFRGKQNEAQNANEIKEILKTRLAKQDIDEPELTKEEQEILNEETAPIEEVIVAMNDEEKAKVEAFNEYMDSVQDQEFEGQTEDDEVLRQLYTPIENQYSVYNEENEYVQYQEEAQIPTEENEDVATIMSSSKLTETRGLYLAKFEGVTSLVGYIQDDIYVLYNFGEDEVSETEIESHLAQESDTDSLYVVKTGGKKLMVKSTPYDLSLEMVMS